MPRGVGFLLAMMGAALATTLILLQWIRLSGVPEPWTSLDAAERFIETAAEMAGSDPGARRIAVVGDSTAVGYPPDRRLSARLAQRWQTEWPSARVFDFSQVGLGPLEQWAMAEVLAGARPDGVLLGFNLASLSPAWEEHPRRPEWVGWVPPERLPRSSALLARMGMSLDELASAVGVVAAGGQNLWRAVLHGRQQIATQRRRSLARLGGPVARPAPYPYGDPVRAYLNRPEGAQRLSAVLEEQYAAAFSGVERDRVSLSLLGETVHRLHGVGAEVWVFVVPINLEVLRNQAFFDEQGLARTLKRLQGVVESAGGRWMDLHTLLPAAGFQDVGGHFTLSPLDGPDRVAEALAAAIPGPTARNGKRAN
ncbi:hypothetical protein MK280_03070 [Myxococcota bacterium]|nr:hypothetical protein [Myxococcota bacterium]